MCGLSGYCAPGGIDATAKELFASVSKSRHGDRGPDDFGVYASDDDRVLLAHSRLSLVDLSNHGHQPMQKHGRVLVFNGEIYNFRLLRQTLEADGYVFDSSSDTEVILSAYDKWGRDCFTRFNGPFALALYDTSTKELTLARDRVGEKPLYYYYDQPSSAIYFGSTIKQIMGMVPKRWALDEERIMSDLIFNFWSDKRHTHIEGILNIPPGTLTIIDTLTGRQRRQTYWQLTNQETHVDEATAVRDIDALLKDAVAMRVQLDTPIGVILSGGLDSTLLTSLAAGDLPYAPRCFTLSRNDHMDEDLFYAQKYCADKQLPHSQVRLQDGDLDIDALVRATQAMEEPSLDQVYLYISRNYETVRDAGLKAVLNGQGADEIFLGYLDYYDFMRDEANYKDQLAFEEFWLKQSPLRPYLDEARAQAVIHANIEYNYQPVRSDDNLNSVLRFGVKTHLQSLLAQEDKQSMRWSVECRTVFTDYRLVEYLSSVPSELKMLDNKEKYLLRTVAKQYLPDYIINRKKLGFPDLPDNRSALIDDMISSGLLDNSSILNNILSNEAMRHSDDFPLSMKWKLCSIAILERSLQQ